MPRNDLVWRILFRLSLVTLLCCVASPLAFAAERKAIKGNSVQTFAKRLAQQEREIAQGVKRIKAVKKLKGQVELIDSGFTFVSNGLVGAHVWTTHLIPPPVPLINLHFGGPGTSQVLPDGNGLQVVLPSTLAPPSSGRAYGFSKAAGNLLELGFGEASANATLRGNGKGNFVASVAHGGWKTDTNMAQGLAPLLTPGIFTLRIQLDEFGAGINSLPDGMPLGNVVITTVPSMPDPDVEPAENVGEFIAAGGVVSLSLVNGSPTADCSAGPPYDPCQVGGTVFNQPIKPTLYIAGGFVLNPEENVLDYEVRYFVDDLLTASSGDLQVSDFVKTLDPNDPLLEAPGFKLAAPQTLEFTFDPTQFGFVGPDPNDPDVTIESMSLAVDGSGVEAGDLLVTDYELDAVVHVDPVNGDRVLWSNGAEGAACTADEMPYKCCTGAGTNDGAAPCVQVGDGPSFETPHGIAVHPSTGRVVVVDAGLDAVIEIDPDSGDRSVVSQAGVRGTGPAFSNPQGVVFETKNSVIVADSATDAVYRVLLSNGRRSILASGLSSPRAVDLESGGSLLVTEQPGAIQRVAADGTVSLVSNDPLLGIIGGIAVTSSTTALVTDTNVLLEVNLTNGNVTPKSAPLTTAARGITITDTDPVIVIRQLLSPDLLVSVDSLGMVKEISAVATGNGVWLANAEWIARAPAVTEPIPAISGGHGLWIATGVVGWIWLLRRAAARSRKASA